MGPAHLTMLGCRGLLDANAAAEAMEMETMETMRDARDACCLMRDRVR